MALVAENAGHKPVMLQEVMAALSPVAGECYVDGTFGGGGYTRAFLEAADCSVCGVDRDPAAADRASEFSSVYGARFTFLKGRFGDVRELLAGAGVEAVDALVLDIGVSSFQFDQAERGFSFRFDGPLDMRMSAAGESAADIVNSRTRDELADIFYLYGEERNSRKIAAAIVHDRAEKPFETTLQLAELIARITPGGQSAQKIHPATRVFQALRIAVNDELGELERGLVAAEHVLRENGRLVVVTFHSLEDRIVKRFFQSRAGHASQGSRHAPAAMQQAQPSFKLVKKTALKPGRQECEINPRARSAKLRYGVRTAAPAMIEGAAA